ncbi:MAG: photosynthetic reaction center subunit H [Pseudomonadota bacterium]
MDNAFFANFDLASLAIWLFWVFFALLIFYIQRENMREGYPLEDDNGDVSANQGPFPVPGDKTFILPQGRGELTVPSGQRGDRDNLALERTSDSNGFPFEPTGDPMADGVGPASWAPREDAPELDGHGHPKIVPMAALDDFHVSAGNDPRGLPVLSGDRKVVGKISDIWIDAPEQLVRYVEIALDEDYGSGKRLVPLTLSRVQGTHVKVKSLYGHQFDGIPKNASKNQVTKLEEDKISGYCAGGWIYASAGRFEPLIG